MVDFESVVFSYDGARLREDQTPGEVSSLLHPRPRTKSSKKSNHIPVVLSFYLTDCQSLSRIRLLLSLILSFEM